MRGLESLIQISRYDWLTNFLEFIYDVIKNFLFVKFFSFMWKILPWNSDFTFYGITTAYLLVHLKGSRPIILKALYAICFVFLGYIDNYEMSSYLIENSQEIFYEESKNINPEIVKTESSTLSTDLVTPKKEYLPKVPLLVILHLINFLMSIGV